MGDSNNHLAGQLPPDPYPQLHQLDRLVGEWRVSGPFLQGTLTFEWMEGGFFLIQRVTAEGGGRTIRGIEYIGYDEDSSTCRSHYLDIHGANFTYTYEMEGDTIRIWFGERGSDNAFVGRFADDGMSYSGEWKWPGGGYSATMTRTSSQ
ncbi:MAG: hypothetical protein ABSE77_10355 [Acidimicrobiales bacterium]|jgi:hypothetical protein